MENFVNWTYENSVNFPFCPKTWTKVFNPETTLPEFWSGATSKKVLGYKFPEKLDPNKATVLGGICSIFTAEMEQIRKREVVFPEISFFQNWIQSWYPRIDQLHDAVGIPPKNCARIVYVCEDSIFARKLAQFTGLAQDELQIVLRNVHETQGHSALCRWIESFGYSGKIEVVYTSDLEREMDVALRIWERLLGFSFASRDIDGAKVKMMYTGLWPDVLGVSGSVVIYEPANHMYLDNFSKLTPWFRENEYGQIGVNQHVGIAGYVPFWLSGGLSRVQSFEKVPNFGNISNFEMPQEDILWYALNILYGKKDIEGNFPNVERPSERVMSTLKKIYGG